MGHSWWVEELHILQDRKKYGFSIFTLFLCMNFRIYWFFCWNFNIWLIYQIFDLIKIALSNNTDAYLNTFNIKQKIQIIKRYDLRTETSIDFYICASRQSHLSQNDKKNDTEYKFMPVYANEWLIIYEGLVKDSSIYTFKVLDMKNRRTLVTLNNRESINSGINVGGKSKNLGIGYLYFMG